MPSLQAVDRLLRVWNRSYEPRIARLAARANASTLADDAEALDELCGEGDLEWFLKGSGDLISDQLPGEIVRPLA